MTVSQLVMAFLPRQSHLQDGALHSFFASYIVRSVKNKRNITNYKINNYKLWCINSNDSTFESILCLLKWKYAFRLDYFIVVQLKWMKYRIDSVFILLLRENVHWPQSFVAVAAVIWFFFSILGAMSSFSSPILFAKELLYFAVEKKSGVEKDLFSFGLAYTTFMTV